MRPDGNARFRLLVGAFFAVATLLAGAGTHAGGPEAPRIEADRLAQENAALEAAAQETLLELYALETELGRAERRAARLQARIRALEREETSARRRLAVAREAESVAQERLGDRLTALYVEGETDPLEVILGASSLDGIISAFDGLVRLAQEDDRIIRQAGSTRAGLRAALRELAERERETRALASEAVAARDSLAAARDGKASYLGSLRREQALNEAEIGDLAAQAVQAEQRTAAIEAAQEAPATADVREPAGRAAQPLEDGQGNGRRLTVDAVAYSLPGHTASGLPVGKGVVAVDPAVIPLGTRMYVPGYGPAVAADVGTAIRGFIIDLWFPTYEEAVAWGRKTVTITIYG